MGRRVVAALPPPSNVVFDVDGCLVVGGEAVAGAAEALGACSGRGITTVVATNNSTRTPAEVAARVSRLTGYPLAPEAVVTSAEATVGLLGAQHDPVLVIGEEGIRRALAIAGFNTTDDPEAAGAVVVGLDRSFDYDLLWRAATAAARGAALFATNTDVTLPVPGATAPGAGALLAAVEAASGRRATVAGKPHPPMVACVGRVLAPGATWVVGDRPETDVAFARGGGWSAVLVLSGVTKAASATGDWPPDAVIGSVAEIPGLLAD